MKLNSSILAVAVSMFLPSRVVIAGHGFGNGGDPLALAFVVKGLEISDFLKSNPQVGPAIDRLQFANTVTETNIWIKTEQLLDNDGNAVSARFVPINPQVGNTKAILLNKSDWLDQLLRPHPEYTYRFVLHEYLWSIGVNDTNYQVSATVDLSNLVQNFENPRTEFPIGDSRRIWESELKIPLARTPGLICSTIADQVNGGLRNMPHLRSDSSRCWIESIQLIFIAKYESDARHLLRYHFTGGFESQEACILDEQDQKEIIRKHLTMEPLSYSCRIKPGPAPTKWEALIVSLRRER